MAIPREPCPKCGANIGLILFGALMGDREMYCVGCGHKVAIKCQKCGALLMVTQHYCPRCGTKNPIFVEKE